MNSASTVRSMIEQWTAEGLSKSDIVVKTAEACLGWPYVWGSYGQECTVSNRQAYMNRSSIAAGDRELIRKRCQILNGSSGSCKNCKYYPDSQRTLIFDCRGFTRWVLARVGISLQGAGATSQWNTESNWIEKGLIQDMPRDKVCCVFQKNPSSNVMEHTGLGIGGTNIIHCSVEVKTAHTYDKGWTHYAIPKGLDGTVPPGPEPTPTPSKPTIRKGSSGQYVTECQKDLLKLGYDLGSYGADGKFGAKTEAAVKAFQSVSGLKADGICGPKTWDALDKAVEKAPETPPIPVVELYTVTIPHLTYSDAEALVKKYAGASKRKEGGE